MHLDFPVILIISQSVQLSVSRSVNLLSISPPPLPVVYLNTLEDLICESHIYRPDEARGGFSWALVFVTPLLPPLAGRASVISGEGREFACKILGPYFLLILK